MVLAIILFIAYSMFKIYFNQSLTSSRAQGILTGQDVLSQDAVAPNRTVVSSVREKLQKAQRQHAQQLQDILK